MFAFSSYLCNMFLSEHIHEKILYFEWTPPWHFKTGIPIWHSIWHSIWRSIWHSYLAFLSGILSGILLWHSIWHSIWHSYLAFLSGILLWHSIWHSIWRSIWHSIWHIFWHSLRRLRSGREHLAWILAVEVRQGTLGVDGRGAVRQGTLGVDSRGWGPAGNTGRGFSRLRSGREHLAWMGVDGRGWGPEEAEGGRRRKSTDIKSNNPHLAGGEKTKYCSKTLRGGPLRWNIKNGKRWKKYSETLALPPSIPKTSGILFFFVFFLEVFLTLNVCNTLGCRFCRVCRSAWDKGVCDRWCVTKLWKMPEEEADGWRTG